MTKKDLDLAAITFVHLGENDSPTLNHMAEIASSSLKNSECILITDHPESWEDFPGRIIKLDRSALDEILKGFTKRHAEIREIAWGYWYYTM